MNGLSLMPFPILALSFTASLNVAEVLKKNE